MSDGTQQSYDYGKTKVSEELVFPKSGEWARIHWSATWQALLFLQDRLNLSPIRVSQLICGLNTDSPYLDSARIKTLTGGPSSNADTLHTHTIPVSLDELTDVDTTGATSGQSLVFDGTDWGPGTITAGVSNADFDNLLLSLGALQDETGEYISDESGEYIFEEIGT